MTDQPVLHRLLLVRGAFVAREEDRQPFILQRPQDVRRRVDRCVIDDRDAVQQHEVMPDERLDDVGFVANVRGTEQPHDVGSFSAG